MSNTNSLKPSLGIFFNIFSVARTSLNGARDRGIISLRSKVPWFNFFAFDWDNFLECFILVKPITSEAHVAFCSSSTLVGSIYFWVCGFHKYWSMVHFYQPIPFYHFSPTSLSLEKVNMKEDLHVWYQGLEYEEWFGPGEVLLFQQKKKWIDTHTIISASEHFERQKLFGEDGDMGDFFLNMWLMLLQIIWISWVNCRKLWCSHI